MAPDSSAASGLHSGHLERISFFIFPGRTELQAGGTKAGSQIRLDVNDLDYIRAEVPLLKHVSPEVEKQCLVAYGTRSATYGVSGVYAAYGSMRQMVMAEGAFFSAADDFTHTRVAVIGSDAKRNCSRTECSWRDDPPGRHFIPGRWNPQASDSEWR